MARKRMITSKLKYEIIKRDGGICQYCRKVIPIVYMDSGKPFLAYGHGKSPFHFDHIVPKKLGGKTEINNLVLACSGCNMSKGIKDKDTFIALLKARGKIK